MGDRYYITCVQLGCLMAQSLSKQETKKILDGIHEEQYLCNANGFSKLLRMFASKQKGVKDE